ncbi:MAG: hypothetical protein RR280_08620 [Bacteroidaceae bacterium]
MVIWGLIFHTLLSLLTLSLAILCVMALLELRHVRGASWFLRILVAFNLLSLGIAAIVIAVANALTKLPELIDLFWRLIQ